MRLGIYLGRHAGGGGGIGVYARGFAQSLVRLLEEPARKEVEIVFYGDESILDAEFFEALETSSVLSVWTGGSRTRHVALGFRSARRVFRKLPNGGRVRILVRSLPSLPGGKFLGLPRKLNTLLDQLSVPVLAAYDGVHILHSLANIGLMLSSKPQVITVHDLYQAWNTYSKVRPGLTTQFYRLLFSRQFKIAERIITDAGHVAAEIRERYAVPEIKCKTIPLGLDPAFLEAFSGRTESECEKFVKTWLEKSGAEPDSVLLFASSDPRKNLSRTLAAWRMLPEPLRRTPLSVKVLDAGAARAVKQFSSEFPVTILPWCERPELVATYLVASVVLVPSLAEGFGYPALEALLCGCRVVSGPVEYLASGAPEGYFECDPESESSIAEALGFAIAGIPAQSQATIGSSRRASGDDRKHRNLRNLLDRIRAFQGASRTSKATGEGKLRRTIADATAETFQVYTELGLRLGVR